MREDTEPQTMRSTRRTVVRGAAWSVPVIAVATTAPAFAASPCSTLQSHTTSWETSRYYGEWVRVRGNWQYVERDRGYGLWQPSSGPAVSYLTQDPDGNGQLLPVRLDISVAYGTNVQAAADQFAVTGQNVGATNSRGLTLHQRPVNTSQQSSTLLDRNKSVLTFAFNRPVSSLTFTMTDIDSASNDFRDAVGISGATLSSVSIQNTSQVQGAGSVADPFRVVPTNSAVDNFSQNGGNVTVTLTNISTLANTSTFQLHYWNFQPQGAGDDQKVYLTNFQVSYKPC